MGKLKSAAQEWLNDYGYNLGFEPETMPSESDWDTVVMNNVKVWEYRGKTKKEYYGGK